MSGTGSLILQKGTTILAGHNTYSGSTILNGGQLGISHDNALGTSLLVINGGTIRAVGSGHTITNYTDVYGSFTIGRLTNFNQSVIVHNAATITAGNPDGTFKPGDPVGRGSMAAFMYRLGGGVLG